MDEILSALILGIIQGLTEFLPVSSSGHLELAKYFLGRTEVGEASMLMTVLLHFATALSTIVVFRKVISELIKGILSPKWNEDKKYALFIIISMLPAVIVGICFESQVESLFSGQIIWVAFALIFTGILLWISDHIIHNERKVGGTSALVIGMSQMFAIIPGISRSGATIATSIFFKIDRKRAAQFSFLMVIPLIIGKMILDLGEGTMTKAITDKPLSLLIGFAAAFFTGMWACKAMLNWVQKSKLKYFGYYCFVIAIIVIICNFL